MLKNTFMGRVSITHFLKLEVNANQGYVLMQFLFTVPTTWVRLVLLVNRYTSHKRTNSLLFLISKREKQFAF